MSRRSIKAEDWAPLPVFKWLEKQVWDGFGFERDQKATAAGHTCLALRFRKKQLSSGITFWILSFNTFYVEQLHP